MGQIDYSDIFLNADSSDVFGNESNPILATRDNDEIVCEEVGVEVTSENEFVNSNDHITIQDEEQAVRFPPWDIDRMVLDLSGVAVDVGKPLFKLIKTYLVKISFD